MILSNWVLSCKIFYSSVNLFFTSKLNLEIFYMPFTRRKPLFLSGRSLDFSVPRLLFWNTFSELSFQTVLTYIQNFMWIDSRFLFFHNVVCERIFFASLNFFLSVFLFLLKKFSHKNYRNLLEHDWLFLLKSHTKDFLCSKAPYVVWVAGPVLKFRNLKIYGNKSILVDWEAVGNFYRDFTLLMETCTVFLWFLPCLTQQNKG